MGYKLIKSIVENLTPKKIKDFWGRREVETYKKSLEYSTASYAQEGEDVILNRFFENKTNGFYVDIGAHHPKRFSNTYIFYKKGWRGINIDPLPGTKKKFDEERHGDINLECGVSQKAQELTYYMFNEPALNTFSKEEAASKNGLRAYKIIEERTIKTYPLSRILNENMLPDVKIDFMSVDVEGLDLEVLMSNNWNLYRPNLLLVEDLKKIPLIDLKEKSELFKFLTQQEYRLVSKTFNTLFFKDSRT